MKWMIFVALGLTAPAIAAAPLDEARTLVAQKKFPEARAALEQIVAAEPDNAAACHELGLVLQRRSDPPAHEEAVKWLARAAELEPKNPIYLGDFGGASLQLASRTRSLFAATRGREAMEKAIALDPGYLDAREGLYQFYQRAPWPLGSSAKAAAQLEEIRRRDPDRATVLGIMARITAKDFAAAFQLAEDVLRRSPENYVAHYYYGRAAAVSGQRLAAGLEHLQRCVALEPPSPAAPQLTHAWRWIGNIQAQLGRPHEARAAYQTALQLDPGNAVAAEALAKLK